jgi:cytochrome c-type biogenesis protein CcmH
MTRTTLFFALLLTFASSAGAVEPSEVLADPILESRARALSVQIRCLVCQNQSIDDSNADLARDLRTLVRERLVAGDSDQGVLDYLSSRYGDFVLLKPPIKPETWALWFGPIGIVLMAFAGAAFYFRRRRYVAPQGGDLLADDEARQLSQLLGEDGEQQP